MVKLKLQYFDPLMQKACSFVKTLMLSKIKSRRSKGQHRIRWLDGITDLTHMSLSKMFETVKVIEARRAAVHRVTKSRTQWSN